ncbi:MAG: sulfate transporter [Deltaproteobacteria bacterium]|nr:sulfate transporter [Deltaproteobacteria bacterium]
MNGEGSTEQKNVEAPAPAAAPWKRWRAGPNRYGASEIAGAFGDLGTLIPFVVGYLTVLKLDPTGVLLGFGIAMLFAGLYYRTPVPVQPMKAIGATAITMNGATVTAGTVGAAALVTGVIWLVLGLTGAIRWITALAAKPVVRGIILGLGISFVITGVKDIVAQPLVGGIGLALTLLLLAGRIPVMFLLLLFGVAAGLVLEPKLLGELSRLRPGFALPQFGIGSLAWNDFTAATLLLALPQIPLTVGNAVIAVTAEHNRNFPERSVSERMIAVTTGMMNTVSAAIGGIPLCHGAGGLAGHLRFGARTGGATVILGAILIVLGLFFGGSVATIFQLFPKGVLGVIICFAGLELATAGRDMGTKEEAYTTILVAGFAIFHMGIAFLVGVALHFALQRRWVKI